MIAAGADKLSLSCTTCQEPNVTARASSAYCLAYDVVVQTSYDGFLSDSFFVSINRPDHTVQALDAEGFIWNWTREYGNGWWSRINYTTSFLCANAPPQWPLMT
jgi:hypothetical protein